MDSVTALDCTPREVLMVRPVTPTDWCVYETPKGHERVGIELELPRLREDIANGSTQIVGGGVTESDVLVSDGKTSRTGRHAFVRIATGRTIDDELEAGYDVYVPLEGAPTWWVKRAKREGFCLALVPSNDDGQVPFLVTGAPEQGPSPPPTGRNEPCTCGSGRKFKRCCGAVDA